MKNLLFILTLSQHYQSSGSQDPFITTTLDMLSSIHTESKKVIFCWVPSHFGIPRNEQADSAAKAVLTGRMSHNPVPHTNFISRHIFMIYGRYFGIRLMKLSFNLSNQSLET